MLDPARLQAAYQQVRDELLAERTPEGHWVGELSSSALSTATAVSALAVVRARVQGSGFGVQEGDRGKTGEAETPSAQHSAPSTQYSLPGTLYSVLSTPSPPHGGEAIAPHDFDSLIRRGVSYLLIQQNPDGGFGDTDLSHSNIATTMLVVAALHLAGVADEYRELIARADAYIDSKGRLQGLRERYGVDKTFVVPILTNCALAGLVDWSEVDPLPFELACVPQALYRFVGMPVVSYAIPALVAIGQARYFHRPPRNPFTRFLRFLSITRSLKVLRRMQPESGGYLEATPLTSFVVMSVASCGPLAPRAEAPHDEADPRSSRRDANSRDYRSRSERTTVIREGVKFLANSIRPDGSWPIDTNLATWNTTLAINALAGAGEDVAELLGDCEHKAAGAVGNALRGVPGVAMERQLAGPGTAQRPFPTGNVLDWLLSCQHTRRHPFTGADPGGFGWTDLSGAVPDADDTAGALLALDAWKPSPASNSSDREPIEEAVLCAVLWLQRLQNRDGGWPTFCRGWGRLPFDRSGTDLTAHVLRALSRWPLEDDARVLRPREDIGTAHDDAHQFVWFLRTHQSQDGSWSPLWFGNQDHPEEDNPVYGTAKVLFAYRDLGLMDSPEAQRGVAWLVANQNEDGGWGSGVWGMRNAEFGVRNREERLNGTGVQWEMQVTDAAPTDHSVLSTQYLVRSNDAAASIPHSALRTPHLTSSVEETALAVEALLAALPIDADARNATEGVPYNAVERGLSWLIERVEQNQHRQPAPIGFYFAKLWYYERLYPLTFTVAALGRALRTYPRLESGTDSQSEARRSP